MRDKWLFLLCLILLGGTVTFAQDIPTIPGLDNLIPGGELMDELGGAVDGINDLPADPLKAAGVEIDPQISRLFGYIKWVFSPTMAYELLGRTLGPIGLEVMVIMTLTIVMTSIWFVINLVTSIIKIIAWIWNMFSVIIQLIAALINAAASAITAVSSTIGKAISAVVEGIALLLGR